MTNIGEFGISSARNNTSVERSVLGDVAESARVRRTPAGLRLLAEQTGGTVVGPSPTAEDGLSRLWIMTASQALAAGRRNATTGGREVEITDVAAMPLPEELLPVVKGLSLGKSDVTVSRLLDMSPRTFSRKVADLLAYLEVETRFQAGAEVAYRRILSAIREVIEEPTMGENDQGTRWHRVFL